MNGGLNPGKKRITIIGGGIAGVKASEAARKQSPDAEIILIHDEPGLPYNRLNLTRMIAGEVSPEELEQHPAPWYDERRIIHVHDRVTGIDRKSKTVILEKTGESNYTALVLATGACPFIPPIPGMDKNGVMPLRTLEQAREILRNVHEGTRCVCMGGGLLGIELAAGLSRRGARVTVLEGSASLLPRQLSPRAGAELRSRIEALGLEVRCGERVVKIEGKEKVEGVLLESGETIGAEMVLVSTGVRPNTALAMDCGLDVGRGVKVDDSMRTSDPDIFAAGDVAEHRGVTYGLWVPAMKQGKVAGANAAGGDMRFTGIPPSAFLKVVGVDVFSIGTFIPEGEDDTVLESEGENYSCLVLRDGKVIGANLVGDTSAAVTVKSAVEKGMPAKENPRLVKLFPGLE